MALRNSIPRRNVISTLDDLSSPGYSSSDMSDVEQVAGDNSNIISAIVYNRVARKVMTVQNIGLKVKPGTSIKRGVDVEIRTVGQDFFSAHILELGENPSLSAEARIEAEVRIREQDAASALLQQSLAPEEMNEIDSRVSQNPPTSIGATMSVLSSAMSCLNENSPLDNNDEHLYHQNVVEDGNIENSSPNIQNGVFPPISSSAPNADDPTPSTSGTTTATTGSRGSVRDKMIQLSDSYPGHYITAKLHKDATYLFTCTADSYDEAVNKQLAAELEWKTKEEQRIRANLPPTPRPLTRKNRLIDPAGKVFRFLIVSTYGVSFIMNTNYGGSDKMDKGKNGLTPEQQEFLHACADFVRQLCKKYGRNCPEGKLKVATLFNRLSANKNVQLKVKTGLYKRPNKNQVKARVVTASRRCLIFGRDLPPTQEELNL